MKSFEGMKERPRTLDRRAAGNTNPTGPINTLYCGTRTSNLMAASCSGDLPMLSNSGSHRGSSWMLANVLIKEISDRPASLYLHRAPEFDPPGVLRPS